jgi:hypothetical protein
MPGTEQLTVDSTYRWIEVLLLATALAVCLTPGAYNKGFPKQGPLHMILGAFLLVAAGVVLAPVFGESIVDALLLRARFGFIVPDVHPHGYGWAFVFGYALILANAALLVVGAAMTALGKLPPWIAKNRHAQSKDPSAT